jgi:hypothetical protein
MHIYKSQICLIVLLVSSSSILAFRYSFSLLPKCLLAWRIAFFRVTILLWFWFCNHCFLAFFLWSNNREYSSSNLGLCSFHSYRLRLRRWGFDTLFNVFSSPIYVLPIIYVLQGFRPVCDHNLMLFPTSSSLSFLRLMLSTSNLYAVYLLTPNFSLTFAATR